MNKSLLARRKVVNYRRALIDDKLNRSAPHKNLSLQLAASFTMLSSSKFCDRPYFYKLYYHIILPVFISFMESQPGVLLSAHQN